MHSLMWLCVSDTKSFQCVFQLIWLLHTVRWAVSYSNREKHHGALRLIFPLRVTCLQCICLQAWRSDSPGIEWSLSESGVKWGGGFVRECCYSEILNWWYLRFQHEVSCLETSQPALLVSKRWKDKWRPQGKHINTALQTLKLMSFFGSVSTLSPRPRTCLPWSRGCRYSKWSPGSAFCAQCLNASSPPFRL